MPVTSRVGGMMCVAGGGRYLTTATAAVTGMCCYCASLTLYYCCYLYY